MLGWEPDIQSHYYREEKTCTRFRLKVCSMTLLRNNSQWKLFQPNDTMVKKMGQEIKNNMFHEKFFNFEAGRKNCNTVNDVLC